MKLFIAIPSYKFIQDESVHCMFKLSSAEKDWLLGLMGGEGFVGRCRDMICSKFLESDYDKLLMIDSDIIYTPEHVVRISSHDEGVVCGFYTKKAPGLPMWVANAKKDSKVDERGLINLDTIGTGFMCLKREVLEVMRDSKIATRYIVDGTDIVEYEFFPWRVVNGKRRSEDWAFCDNCYEAGFEVYGDSKVTLGHLGSCVYPTPEAVAIRNTLKVIQQLQNKGVTVPKEILESLQVDPSANVAQ